VCPIYGAFQQSIESGLLIKCFGAGTRFIFRSEMSLISRHGSEVPAAVDWFHVCDSCFDKMNSFL